MLTCVFAILFLLRRIVNRVQPQPNPFSIIRGKYGNTTYKLARSLKNHVFKQHKADLDEKFNQTCREHKLTPRYCDSISAPSEPRSRQMRTDLPHLVSSVSFKFLLLYTAIYLNIYPKNPPAVYIFMLCYVL